MRRLARLALLAPVFAAAALFGSVGGRATEMPGAHLTLLVGAVTGTTADVGLEIALEPGWKTYWRHPGDAGVPPSFSAAASTGVAAAEPRYPLPERFDEAGLIGLGWTAPVILPFDVRLAAADRPAKLVLDVQIGLCRDICVPYAARVEATIDPAAPVGAGLAGRLAAARAALPRPAAADALPKVMIVRLDRDTTPPVVTVEVAEPEGLAAADADLLVEGPTTDWALPVPKLVELRPGVGIWSFALDGVPPAAAATATTVPLRFTLRAGREGREQIRPLVAPPAAP